MAPLGRIGCMHCLDFYHIPCMTPSRDEIATLLRLKRKVGRIVHGEDVVPSMNRESAVVAQVSSTVCLHYNTNISLTYENGRSLQVAAAFCGF